VSDCAHGIVHTWDSADCAHGIAADCAHWHAEHASAIVLTALVFDILVKRKGGVAFMGIVRQGG